MIRRLADTIRGGIILGLAGLALLSPTLSIVAAVWWAVAASLGAK